MTDHLSVGVLISTFNRFDSCVEAARSALRQTHTNLQVFVIDDQSTDPRYATLTSLVSDSRLVYLRLPISSRQATGFPCAGYVRNAGARLFTGDYIAVLDDDDIWLPTKIERQLELMKRHGSEVCCTDGYI
jgi:glycosyltransferase involved in cell wall biosynthesis